MKSTFPRTNQHFAMNDKRYPSSINNERIFKCLASDSTKVVALVVADTYCIDKNRKFILNRADNEFLGVSAAVVKAATKEAL